MTMETATRARGTKSDTIEIAVPLPQGVTAQVSQGIVQLKGAAGEVSRKLQNKSIAIQATGNEVRLSAAASGKNKKIVGTFTAHIKNMVKGCAEGHEYRLKICAGHFPMTVTASGKEFIVKNLLGEKTPRKVAIRNNVDVKVSGTDVVVTSSDKEAAGQMAADIEQLTRRPGFDKRVFQDGIYITVKDGEPIQ